MLNKELLFKSINGINDDLLLRSESDSYNTDTSRKKKLRIFAAAISAIIGVTILFVALMLYGESSMDGYNGTTVPSSGASQEASPESSGGYSPNNIASGEWADDDIHYESAAEP